MPTRERRLPFDAKTIGERIEEERVRLGIPIDEGTNPLWRRVGLSNRTHWHAKVSGARPFRWEQVAKLVLEFQAPAGWPILSRRDALAFERWLEAHEQPPEDT